MISRRRQKIKAIDPDLTADELRHCQSIALELAARKINTVAVLIREHRDLELRRIVDAQPRAGVAV